MQATRLAFYTTDRGAVTSLKKLLIRMQRMDVRRATRATKAGRTPVLFANAEPVSQAMELLISRCTEAAAIKA